MSIWTTGAKLGKSLVKPLVKLTKATGRGIAKTYKAAKNKLSKGFKSFKDKFKTKLKVGAGLATGAAGASLLTGSNNPNTSGLDKSKSVDQGLSNSKSSSAGGSADGIGPISGEFGKLTRTVADNKIKETQLELDKAKSRLKALSQESKSTIDTNPGSQPDPIAQYLKDPLVSKYTEKHSNEDDKLKLLSAIAKLLHENNELVFRSNNLLASANRLDFEVIKGELAEVKSLTAELNKRLQKESSANADVVNKAQVPTTGVGPVVVTGGSSEGNAVEAKTESSSNWGWLGLLLPALAAIGLGLSGKITEGFNWIGEKIGDFGALVGDGFDSMLDLVGLGGESGESSEGEESDKPRSKEEELADKVIKEGQDKVDEIKTEAAVKAGLAGVESAQALKNEIKGNVQAEEVKPVEQAKNEPAKAEPKKEEVKETKKAETKKKENKKKKGSNKQAKKQTRMEKRLAERKAKKEAAKKAASKVTTKVSETATKKAIEEAGEQVGKKGFKALGKSASKLLSKVPLMNIGVLAFDLNEAAQEKDPAEKALKTMSAISLLGGPVGMVAGLMIDAIRTNIQDARNHESKIYDKAISDDIDRGEASILNRAQKLEVNPFQLIEDRFGGPEYSQYLSEYDNYKKLQAIGSLLSAYQLIEKGDPQLFSNATQNTSKLWVPFYSTQDRLRRLGINMSKSPEGPSGKYDSHNVWKGDTMNAFNYNINQSADKYNYENNITQLKKELQAAKVEGDRVKDIQSLSEDNYQKRIDQESYGEAVSDIWRRKEVGSAIGETAVRTAKEGWRGAKNLGKKLINKISFFSEGTKKESTKPTALADLKVGDNIALTVQRLPHPVGTKQSTPVYGKLFVNGKYYCDTYENAPLDPGTYKAAGSKSSGAPLSNKASQSTPTKNPWWYFMKTYINQIFPSDKDGSNIPHIFTPGTGRDGIKIHPSHGKDNGSEGCLTLGLYNGKPGWDIGQSKALWANLEPYMHESDSFPVRYIDAVPHYPWNKGTGTYIPSNADKLVPDLTTVDNSNIGTITKYLETPNLINNKGEFNYDYNNPLTELTNNLVSGLFGPINNLFTSYVSDNITNNTTNKVTNKSSEYIPLSEPTLGVVGDGLQSERVINPDGTEAITPDVPTLTYLEKGTIIEPSTARLQNKRASYIKGIPLVEVPDEVPQFRTGTLTGDKADVVTYAMSKFIKQGYTPVQAAGIVGNLMGEGLLHGKGYGWEHNDVNGPSAGIAQFHDISGKKGELSKLKEWARSHGRTWNELGTQIDYLIESAIPARPKLEASLKNSKSISEAAFHWGNKYEIFGPGKAYQNPHHPEYAKRTGFGQDAFSIYNTNKDNVKDLASATGPGKGEYKPSTMSVSDPYVNNMNITGNSGFDTSGIESIAGEDLGALSKMLGDQFDVSGMMDMVNPQKIFDSLLSTVPTMSSIPNSSKLEISGMTETPQVTAEPAEPEAPKEEKKESKDKSTASNPSQIVSNSGNTIYNTRGGDTTIINNYNSTTDSPTLDKS